LVNPEDLWVMTELVILAILGAGAAAFGSQDLGLRTWVSGPGSLVAGGHGLCGRFRHRKSLWPVPPQKTLPERRRTDARTHTQFVIIYKIVGNPWLCHSSHPERSFKLYCLLGCFLVRLHTTNPITKLCFHSKGPPSRANLGTHVGTSTFFEWGVLMVILSPKDVRFELGDPDFSL
jgi:hypothetical protein